MISNCDENKCPGWIFAIAIGIVMYFTMTFMWITDARADVRVDMTRELPNETQHIVRTFNDREDFEMWMSMRLEDGGCDPYVTKMVVNLNSNPI
jgi:hypothetical protein